MNSLGCKVYKTHIAHRQQIYAKVCRNCSSSASILREGGGAWAAKKKKWKMKGRAYLIMK